MHNHPVTIPDKLKVPKRITDESKRVRFATWVGFKLASQALTDSDTKEIGWITGALII
jgi:hypothetical protein